MIQGSFPQCAEFVWRPNVSPVSLGSLLSSKTSLKTFCPPQACSWSSSPWSPPELMPPAPSLNQLRMGSSPGLSTCRSLQCFPIPPSAAPASSPIPLGGWPPPLWHFCSSFRAHSITKEITYSDHNSWNSLRIYLIRLTRLCKSCKHATIAGKFLDGFFALSSTHQPSNFTSSTRICVKK